MKRLPPLLPPLGAFVAALLIAATAALGQTAEFKKPDSAELQYTGKRHAFTLSLVPGVWEKVKQVPNPSIEVAFMHRDGDVNAGVISERTQLSSEALKRLVLYNLREHSRGPIKTLSETRCVVNGKEMSRLVVSSATFPYGAPVTMYYQLYAGKEGVFQVFAWAPSNAFDDVKSDLEDFFNGFEVTAKPAHHVAEQRPPVH
jgi:hypothetical protein